MIKRCVICGADFKASPSSKKITCSRACSAERKRQTHTGITFSWSAEARQRKAAAGMNDNLRKGTPAAQTSPKAGAYETNQNALTWVIQAPDGQVYTVRNLSLWLRKHAEMLDGTPEQAKAGIIQIRRCVEGKTKRAVTQWKGWRLLRWYKKD